MEDYIEDRDHNNFKEIQKLLGKLYLWFEVILMVNIKDVKMKSIGRIWKVYRSNLNRCISFGINILVKCYKWIDKIKKF